MKVLIEKNLTGYSVSVLSNTKRCIYFETLEDYGKAAMAAKYLSVKYSAPIVENAQ